MEQSGHFDVIIVGGSFAGLSAAMALGRALRNVLIIDNGRPCNVQTPHAHNLITHDGEAPAAISQKAKDQVLTYPGIQFHQGRAAAGKKTETGFEIETETGKRFQGRKLLFATGLQDLMPPIDGFAACWGISIVHCPYCHGYELRHQPAGILGNGDLGFEFCKMISHWTNKLKLFSNGPSNLSEQQIATLSKHGIPIIEKEIKSFIHKEGWLQQIAFTDGTALPISAVFARAATKQHCEIPVAMGCESNEQGLLKVDDFGRTIISGLFAAGDNSSMFRALSIAIGSGTKAGAFINKELIDETFV